MTLNDVMALILRYFTEFGSFPEDCFFLIVDIMFRGRDICSVKVQSRSQKAFLPPARGG